MNYKRGPSYFLACTLVIGAVGLSAAVASSEPQIAVVTPANAELDDSPVSPTTSSNRGETHDGPRHQCYMCWDI